MSILLANIYGCNTIIAILFIIHCFRHKQINRIVIHLATICGNVYVYNQINWFYFGILYIIVLLMYFVSTMLSERESESKQDNEESDNINEKIIKTIVAKSDNEFDNNEVEVMKWKSGSTEMEKWK